MNRNTLAGAIVAVVWGVAACTPTAPSPTPVVTASLAPSASVTLSPSPSVSAGPSLGPTEIAIMATLTGYYKGRDYLMNNPGVQEVQHVTQWATGEEYFSAIDGVMIVRERFAKTEGETVVRGVRIGVPAKVDGVDTSTTTYCADSTKRTVITKSGERKPAAIPTLQTTATVVLEKGKWKISMIRNQEAPC